MANARGRPTQACLPFDAEGLFEPDSCNVPKASWSLPLPHSSSTPNSV